MAVFEKDVDLVLINEKLDKLVLRKENDKYIVKNKDHNWINTNDLGALHTYNINEVYVDYMFLGNNIKQAVHYSTLDFYGLTINVNYFQVSEDIHYDIRNLHINAENIWIPDLFWLVNLVVNTKNLVIMKTYENYWKFRECADIRCENLVFLENCSHSQEPLDEYLNDIVGKHDDFNTPWDQPDVLNYFKIYKCKRVFFSDHLLGKSNLITKNIDEIYKPKKFKKDYYLGDSKLKLDVILNIDRELLDY